MIYPSGIEGILQLPLSIGSLISGLLSYISILIYYPKIFEKKEIKVENFINNLQKNIKNIEKKLESEEIKNENKNFVEIYKKIDNNEVLSDEEKKLLETIDTDSGALCDTGDFDEDDTYCLNCDKFKKCIKRKRD